MTPTITITLLDYESLHIDTLADLPWYASIEHAARDGWTLCAHSDPTAEGRTGLTVDEAVEAALYDGALIHLSRARP
jgi:hypothetical protein|tara:strand:+ start:982 stop:1212 length:231 start_codon:yes stop_codon:yes gene_type:complete